MTQGALPFEYRIDDRPRGLTGWAGLPVYMDLAAVMDLADSIDRHVGVRTKGRGWTDSQQVLSVILLQLAGGDCVDDLERLEADEGLRTLILRLEDRHLPRRKRRERLRRWPKERTRAVPSPTALRCYLNEFHDEGTEGMSRKGEASVPEPNRPLRGLYAVQRDLLAFAQRQEPESVATLDLDATLVETTKKEALHSYKGFRSYQPTNVWWAEKELVVHSEFRDGNVPAGMGNLRVLKEALRALPRGVRKVRLRSDSAAYEWELLRYCEEGRDERFGRIEFAIGCDVSDDFKKAVWAASDEDWRPLYDYDVPPGVAPMPTLREWAELIYVPAPAARMRRGEYRFLVTREVLEQESLPGLEQPSLPFPTMKLARQTYKVRGVVSNILDLDGEDILRLLDKRMGKSEEVHDVMKRDLAGGQLPSGRFGANAAWWQMMILALDLHSLFKKALDPAFRKKRMKAIRFRLLQLPGRVSERSRQLAILLSAAAKEAASHLIRARTTIASWARPPPS